MSGLFSQEGFPHRGWEYVDCEDLEYDREWCEACETQEIRYVHILKHPNYGQKIRVGSECAKKLCENYDSSEIERVTKQKYKFLNSPRWKISMKGNPHIKRDGYHITIIHNNIWSFVIKEVDIRNEKEVWGNKYKSEFDAKKAAFDKVEELKCVRK